MNFDWLLNVMMFPFEIKSKLEKLISGEEELSQVRNLIIRTFIMTIFVVILITLLANNLFSNLIDKTDKEVAVNYDNLAVINKKELRFDVLNTSCANIESPSDPSFLLEMVKHNGQNSAIINLGDNSFRELKLSFGDISKTIIEKPDVYLTDILGFKNKNMKPESDYFKVIRFEKTGNRWISKAKDMSVLGEKMRLEIAENKYKIIRGNQILFETEDKTYDHNGESVNKNSVDAGFRNVYTYTIGNDVHILRIRSADLEKNEISDHIEFVHYILKAN